MCPSNQSHRSVDGMQGCAFCKREQVFIPCSLRSEWGLTVLTAGLPVVAKLLMCCSSSPRKPQRAPAPGLYVRDIGVPDLPMPPYPLLRILRRC